MNPQKTTASATSSPSESSSVAPPPRTPPETAPNATDELFETWKKKLPEPASLSEGNGASSKCEHHGYVTYTLLAATAKKVPMTTDADLVHVVPWTRTSDSCLRYIALEAIVEKIRFDHNRLVLPNMQEPDDYHFHDIMLSLDQYMRSQRIAFDPKIFDGMMLYVTDKDFASLKGHWEEDANPGKNFKWIVDFDGQELRVTHAHTKPLPTDRDFTNTTKVKDVRVNERKQFVVTGEWRIESDNKGYVGQKMPADTEYRFWPTTKDVVWFDQARSNSWEKLRRK